MHLRTRLAARFVDRLLRKYRAATFLLSLLIVSCGPPGNSQEVSTKTITDIKAAVFPIVCGTLVSSQFHVSQMVGTGFLINDRGDFLTAGHVSEALDGYAREHNCFGAIFVAFGSEASNALINTRWFRITKCQTDHDLDLAACSVNQNLFDDTDLKSRIGFLRLDDLFKFDDGSPVAFTGYPLEMGRPLTSKGFIAARYPNQLLIDKAAWPGASGSPVYTANGKVIGVLTRAGLGIGSGIAYAVPSNTAVGFLRKIQIPFSQ